MKLLCFFGVIDSVVGNVPFFSFLSFIIDFFRITSFNDLIHELDIVLLVGLIFQQPFLKMTEPDNG